MLDSRIVQAVENPDRATDAMHFEGDEHVYRGRPARHDGGDAHV
jgi:hypothetical protein